MLNKIIVVTLLTIGALKASETQAGTCAGWLEAERISHEPFAQNSEVVTRAIDMGFVGGFIAAAGTYLAKPLRKVDADQIEAFLNHYCGNNILDTMPEASTALIEELGGPKADHQWRK